MVKGCRARSNPTLRRIEPHSMSGVGPAVSYRNTMILVVFRLPRNCQQQNVRNTQRYQ